MITVDLNLHPLCWEVLKRDNKYDGLAIRMTCMWQYKIFVSQLRRKDIINASDIKRSSAKLVPGLIYVEQNEENRYGHFISPDRQALFNEIIYNHERSIICALVLSAKASGTFNRNEAFNFFLTKRHLSTTVLDIENLKKYYSRHFRELEDEYITEVYTHTFAK